MRSTTAARRYAAAIFSIAREAGQVPEIRTQLGDLAELFRSNAELRITMLTPLRPVEQRKAVLKALAERVGTGATVRNFYSFLIDRRRLVDFDVIFAEFERLADEALGLLTAEVVSAGPLDERRKDRLRRALTERVGQEVRVDVNVDPALIGGVIAKVGGLILDGSLRTQLGQLRANLTREA
jgi:F-type H+-transporting ATPase subunit delta